MTGPLSSPLVLLLCLLLAASAVLLVVSALASMSGDSVRGSLRCLWRGQHAPMRQPIGGFRCTACGAPGATLADLGFEGVDYVTPPAIVAAREFARDRSPDHHFYRPASKRSS